MKLNSRSSVGLLAIILSFAFTAVYWNHFQNGFHFDDSHTIVNNGYIKDLKYFKQYFTDGATQSSLPTNQAYRPIVTLSAAIDFYLAGKELNPVYFHLSTFLWVIFQAVMMFFMFRHILKPLTTGSAAEYVSLFAVAWYLLHTANAESINYISARSDIISTALVVAAFVVHQYSKGKKRLWALPIVALGIVTKPTVVMYVALLSVHILLFEESVGFTKLSKQFFQAVLNTLKKLIPTLAVCAGFFLLTRYMEPETWIPGGNSTYHYLITQPFVILRYFWTFFVPIDLSADSDWTVITSLGNIRFLSGMLFLVVLGIIILITSKKAIYRPISFGLLWFLISLIPTSSVIPLAEVTNDHRMFYPFVGLVFAVSWSAYLFLQAQQERMGNSSLPKIVAVFIGLMILGGNSYGTYQRNKVWSSDENLWYDVSIKSPKNGRGLMNYGLAKMRRGEYQVAIEYYTKAFSTDYGNHPYLSLNMAICQDAIGNRELAKKYYEESIRKGSSYPDCHYFYAQWLLKNGDVSKASYHLSEVLRLSPGHENARTLLEQLSMRADARLKQLEELSVKEPSAANYLTLSLEYYRLKRFADCIASCEKAIAIQPDYAEAYNNICAAYNELQQYEKGAEACEKALAIDPTYQLAKNNLNWSKSSLNK